MSRKYHNHKLQTTLWHREEEPLNPPKNYIHHILLFRVNYNIPLIAVWTFIGRYDQFVFGNIRIC